MKTTLYVILFLILGVSSLNAQKSNSFGVKAGGVFASLETPFDNITDNNLYLGIFAEFSISEKVSLQPEASIFSNFGNYIYIPVKVKYKVKDKFSVLAGPSLGISLDSESGFRNQFTLGAEAGIEYDILDWLLIEAKYNRGLTDIYNNSSSKQSGLFIGLGYRF